MYESCVVEQRLQWADIIQVREGFVPMAHTKVSTRRVGVWRELYA